MFISMNANIIVIETLKTGERDELGRLVGSEVERVIRGWHRRGKIIDRLGTDRYSEYKYEGIIAVAGEDIPSSAKIRINNSPLEYNIIDINNTDAPDSFLGSFAQNKIRIYLLKKVKV